MTDRPKDVDAAFAEIVASLEREGVGADPPDLDTPSAEDTPGDTATRRRADRGGRNVEHAEHAEDTDGPNSSGSSDDSGGSGDTDVSAAEGDEVRRPAGGDGGKPAVWRGPEGEWDWSWGSDEHYVPPEPPPLPKLQPPTIAALLLIGVGVVLLLVPGLFGMASSSAAPLALISLVCGGIILVLRVRKHPRPSDDDDNGAQV